MKFHGIRLLMLVLLPMLAGCSLFNPSASEAREALQTSIDNDMNGIVSVDDSLVRVAINYYDRWYRLKDKAENCAQAYCCLTQILLNQNSLAEEAQVPSLASDDEILEALNKAKSFAAKTDNDYLQGRTYELEAEFLNQSLNDNKEALEFYQKALEEYESLEGNEYDIRKMYVMGNIARTLSFIKIDINQQYENSYKAFEIAKRIKNTDRISSYAASIAMDLIDSGEEEEALSFLLGVIDEYFEGICPDKIVSTLGYLYSKCGEYDKAEELYDTSILSDPNNASFYYLRANNYLLSEKNLKEAVKDFEEYLNLRDANRNSLTNSIKSIFSRKYQFERSEAERIRISHRNRVLVLGFILLLALLLTGIAYHQKTVLEKDKMIKEYQENLLTVREYCDTLNGIKDMQNSKQNEAISAIDQQLSMLSKLLYIVDYPKDKNSIDYYKFLKTLKSSKLENKDIISIFRNAFDLKYEGAVEKLKEKCPKLTEDDINWISVICSDCSTGVIAFIYDTSPSYVYNKRMALRNKLGISAENQSFTDFAKELTV